jgi:hypothetical protein
LSEPCLDNATTINRKALSEALTKRRKENNASKYSTVHQLPRRVAGGLFDTFEMTKQCNVNASAVEYIVLYFVHVIHAKIMVCNSVRLI